MPYKRRRLQRTCFGAHQPIVFGMHFKSCVDQLVLDAETRKGGAGVSDVALLRRPLCALAFWTPAKTLT
jgi:hypothetical protein